MPPCRFYSVVGNRHAGWHVLSPRGSTCQNKPDARRREARRGPPTAHVKPCSRQVLIPPPAPLDTSEVTNKRRRISPRNRFCLAKKANEKTGATRNEPHLHVYDALCSARYETKNVPVYRNVTDN